MAVIRGGDGDDVQRFAVEHLAVIAVQGEVRVWPALLKLAEGLFVEVASRREAGAGPTRQSRWRGPRQCRGSQ